MNMKKKKKGTNKRIYIHEKAKTGRQNGLSEMIVIYTTHTHVHTRTYIVYREREKRTRKSKSSQRKQ